MVDDCNLLFLLSCEKQKSVCCMTLKQSNNIFIGLSGENFYATLDSQGKYHFLYFGLLGRFKICPTLFNWWKATLSHRQTKLQKPILYNIV